MDIRAPVIIGIFLFVTACFPVLAAGRNIEKSFDVKPGGTLSLDTDMGTVDIISHPENSVQVRVELISYDSNSSNEQNLSRDFELSFNNKGKDVSIKGNLNRSWQWRNHRLQVHFEITVPQRYNLHISTAGGHIYAENIAGRVYLRTSGGRIKLGNITGNVTAKTSGGRIKIGMMKGNLEARTSGGRIDIRGIEGNLDASSSGGSINAELLKQVSKPVKLLTSGGSIRLVLPADFKANLDASTTGGRIYSDFPVTVTGSISASSLHGSMNGGGPEMELRTSGGNIKISKGTR